MDPFANLTPILPVYLSHRNYGIAVMPITISELDLLVRKDYSGNTLININNNETINLNSLSNDVAMINNNLNIAISRLNTVVEAPIDLEKEEMKQRLAYLEEKIQQLEFLLGSN